jgi:hypothetical protein
MATVIIPLEVCGRGFAAQIAVDALIIDVEFARYVLGVFVCGIGHGFPLKMKWNVRKKYSVRSNLAAREAARNRHEPYPRLIVESSRPPAHYRSIQRGI